MANRLRLGIVGLGAQGSACTAQMISTAHPQGGDRRHQRWEPGEETGRGIHVPRRRIFDDYLAMLDSGCRCGLERMTGIEAALSAWEAGEPSSQEVFSGSNVAI